MSLLVLFVFDSALTFGWKEGARKTSTLMFCLKFLKFNGRRHFVPSRERPAFSHRKHCWVAVLRDNNYHLTFGKLNKSKINSVNGKQV